MNRRKIYLQQGFWREILSLNSGTASVENRMLFWSVYNALQNSNICTDVPQDAVMDDANELLFQLLQDRSSGESECFITREGFEESIAKKQKETYSTEELCAIYLLSENNMICEGLSAQYGVLCLNVDLIRRKRWLLYGAGVIYSRNENAKYPYAKGKEYFSSLCNSAIIIDPYILLNREHVVNNLIPLLDNLLPRQMAMKIPFHLTIYSQPKNSKEGDGLTKIVKEELVRLRPGGNICLSIYHIKTTGNGKGHFHSRHIITNNTLINSEDGFCIFSDKDTGKLHSTMNSRIEFVCPILVDSGRKDAECYYNWISICSEESSQLVYSSIPDFRNRLLSLV